MFDDKVKKELAGVLSKLKNNVNVVYFTHEFECGACKDVNEFLTEITGLSDKLNLTVYDFKEDKDKADSYGIDKIPAILLLDSGNNDAGIRFYGIPAGYEINSFITALLEVSGEKEQLSDDIGARISKINKDVHIQVFVSLT